MTQIKHRLSTRFFLLATMTWLCQASLVHAEWPEWISAKFFQSAGDPSNAVAGLASERSDDLVIRGQSMPYYPAPYSPMPYSTAPIYSTVSDPSGVPASGIPAAVGDPTAQALGTPAPIAQAPIMGSGDPFVNGQFTPPPASFDPYAPQGAYGINGPQPYRFGWKEQLEYAITPSQDTVPNAGHFGWQEFNYLKEWNGPGAGGGVWTISPQVNLRLLDGPALPGLAPDLYRFGLGMKYATPVQPGGVSWEFGFTPAFATDFKQNLSSRGWQFDAHIASFWRTNPQWMWVLGVFYWDRLDDIVLPYAGAVWTPSDYFEARLLFPKARLEWFLGTPRGTATWFYVTAEYHVESFEVGFEAPVPPGNTVGQMQLEEWRILGGLRWETGWVETFLETGIVFGREVDFGIGKFDPDEMLMTRVGIKF